MMPGLPEGFEIVEGPDKKGTKGPPEGFEIVEKSEPSALNDVLKQIPSGLASGTAGLLDTARRAAAGFIFKGEPEMRDTAMDKTQKPFTALEESLPKPETGPGRYARSISEAVPGMAIPGGGGLATRALGAIGSGAAGQAAEDFGLGSAGRFIASMIGGGAGSAAGSRFENIPKAVAPPVYHRVPGGPVTRIGGAQNPGEYVPAATRTELEAEKEAQYKFAQDNPRPVPDAPLENSWMQISGRISRSETSCFDITHKWQRR